MEALYWQAEAARKLAQSAFRRAVDLNPNSWQGQVLLGDIYRQRKKWDVATAKYQEAARLKPDSPAPHLGLGMVYWLIGQNERAAESLRKVLEIEPDNTMANFVLGDVYVRVRRFKDAIPHLRKSLARGSDSLVVHGDLGKAFAALGRNNEAIDELRVALPTDQNGELHYQLYSLYKLTGQTELARQALADSERLRKEDSDLVKRRLERAVSAQDNSIPQSCSCCFLGHSEMSGRWP